MQAVIMKMVTKKNEKEKDST